jgi:hypothetical protein
MMYVHNLQMCHFLYLTNWQTTSQWSESQVHTSLILVELISLRAALDYPPFFAYFEKLLSIPAFFIDPKIVDLQNLNYNAWSVTVYQRTTVILTELVLGAALLRCRNFNSLAIFD